MSRPGSSKRVQEASGDILLQIVGDAFVAVTFIGYAMPTVFVFATPRMIETLGLYKMLAQGSILTIMSTCIPLLIWGRLWREKASARYYAYS
jgi:hypothetical protein